MRIWDRSIATQFICLLLLALLLSQVLSMLINLDERGHALRDAYKGEFLSRAEAVARLLETTPPAIENDITRANNTLNTRYWVTAEKPGDPAAWRKTASHSLGAKRPGKERAGACLIGLAREESIENHVFHPSSDQPAAASACSGCGNLPP